MGYSVLILFASGGVCVLVGDVGKCILSSISG